MSAPSQSKSPWANKFHCPGVSELRDGCLRANVPVFEAARELVLSMPGVVESVAWHGVPWRWTLVYECGGPPPRRQTRAFAYLIADPQRLQLCVPLTADCVAVLPVKRFKKHVRDAIVHARTVGGVCWPTWDLPSKAAVEDVEDLLRRKHRLLRSPTDGLAVGA